MTHELPHHYECGCIQCQERRRQEGQRRQLALTLECGFYEVDVHATVGIRRLPSIGGAFA